MMLSAAFSWLIQCATRAIKAWRPSSSRRRRTSVRPTQVLERNALNNDCAAFHGLARPGHRLVVDTHAVDDSHGEAA